MTENTIDTQSQSDDRGHHVVCSFLPWTASKEEKRSSGNRLVIGGCSVRRLKKGFPPCTAKTPAIGRWELFGCHCGLLPGPESAGGKISVNSCSIFCTSSGWNSRNGSAIRELQIPISESAHLIPLTIAEAGFLPTP